MTPKYRVILVRDAEQPMGTNHYRAELRAHLSGRRVATTEWRNYRWSALRDAKRYFPTFEVEDD